MSRVSRLLSGPLTRSLVDPNAMCAICGHSLPGRGGHWAGLEDLYCCGDCAPKLLLLALDALEDAGNLMPPLEPDDPLLHWLEIAGDAFDRWSEAERRRSR